MRTLSCHKLALNWHRGCYRTCPLLHADSRSLQVGCLGEHCGVVESVRCQAIKAVITLRASDSNLLSTTLGGWRRRESRIDRFRLQLPKQIQRLIQLGLHSVQLSKALTVKRIDFESVGGGCSVRGPSDAEFVVANIVSVQVRHIQVHYRKELFSIV